jgi:predicted dehydrogenase
MNSSTRKLGVAIHGVGDVAYAHAASWCKNPHAEIVSVSSRHPDSAQRLADKFGPRCSIHQRFGEVLQDARVDIVNISGPNHVHAEQAIAAVESGRHVLVEKPMALTITFNVDLLGTDGSVRDNRLWVPKLLPGQSQWTAFPTVTPDSADVHHHPFDAQINHFVDCIRHDVESHCNVADAYHTHELCLAIDQSVAEGGRLVRLPL